LVGWYSRCSNQIFIGQKCLTKKSKATPKKAKMVENATDYKYSSAMCHAGLVNNSLVTDYDIGVLPSEYQDYLKSIF
jgi:hypothetical protein